MKTRRCRFRPETARRMRSSPWPGKTLKEQKALGTKLPSKRWLFRQSGDWLARSVPWGTRERETSVSERSGDSVRPGTPGCCRGTENPTPFRGGSVNRPPAEMPADDPEERGPCECRLKKGEMGSGRWGVGNPIPSSPNFHSPDPISFFLVRCSTARGSTVLQGRDSASSAQTFGSLVERKSEPGPGHRGSATHHSRTGEAVSSTAKFVSARRETPEFFSFFQPAHTGRRLKPRNAPPLPLKWRGLRGLKPRIR